MMKWVWYGGAAIIGYIILDKLGVIDQIRSKIGGAQGESADANVARVNYAYTSQENDRRWLTDQYPESFEARAYSSNERDRRWLTRQYPESFIGDAYGQGSQSMSGDYNSIPPLDSIDNQY